MSTLPSFHTWHLVHTILLRASFQYHSGGISSGRSCMSYLYDAWALAFPYTGPQLAEVSLDDLIEELQSRKPVCAAGQLVFTSFGPVALTFEKITSLVVNAMSVAHVHMKTKVDWHGLSTSFKAVEGVRTYFGDILPDLKFYLPSNLFDERVTSAAHYAPLKRIVDDLFYRRDLIIVDPYEGIQPAEKKQSPFSFG